MITKRKQHALYILGISIPSFGLGYWQFELGMASSSAMAMITSIGLTLGGAGILAGLTMLFTKNRLGWFDDDPILDAISKPIFIKKEKREMTKIKKEEPVVETAITKEEPVKKDGSQSESLGLMKREKSLLKRQEELSALVSELETELSQVRENLHTKGWIQSADNGWVIE